MSRSCERSEAGNLAPADELFAVRAKLKELTERERELRQLMLDDPTARTGNVYAVELKTVQSSRTDIKELWAKHRDLMEEYTFPFTQTHCVLKGINEDGEVVSLRRKNEEH